MQIANVGFGRTPACSIKKQLTNRVRNFLKELLNNVIIPKVIYQEKINAALINNNTSLFKKYISEIINLYKIKYNNKHKDDMASLTNGLYQRLCLNLVEQKNVFS